MSGERGVSSVVGIVLILAISLTTITAMMVIGAVALSQAQSDTQLSQMETSMAQMSSKASLAALGGAETQRFDLGRTNTGSVEVDANAGNLTIEYELGENGNTTEVYSTDSFGAVVYRQGDSEVAFQGGGVWKRTGDDGGSMVSPPEYHYQRETLTFPVIRVDGEDSADGHASGTITHQKFQSLFPNASAEEGWSNPVDDASVYVEIQSDYHRGWFEFLDSRTTGEVEHDPENQTVRMDLTVPFEDQYTSAVSVGEDVHTRGNANVDSAEEGTNHASATSAVEDELDGCDESSPVFDAENTTYEGGETYCANESVELTDSTTFNTTDGDITVALADGIDFGGQEVTVDGDNTVRVFTAGTVDLSNADINLGEDNKPDQFVVYVHSDVERIDEAGNLDMRGIIYAPNTDIEFSGTVNFEGAIIANSFEGSGNVDVSYDDDLSELQIEIGTDLNVIRYLHVTENVIDVSLD